MIVDVRAFLEGLNIDGDRSPPFDPDNDAPVAAGGEAVRTTRLPIVDINPNATMRTNLRQELAAFLRNARQTGDRDRAVDVLERFKERAAIMEFDGCLLRPEAERLALKDVLAALRKPVATPVPQAATRPEESGDGAAESSDPWQGLVNPGWTPEAWRHRLLQLADRCEAVRPDLAAAHRARAAQIEALSRSANHANGRYTQPRV